MVITVMCLNAAKLIAEKEETPVVPLAPYADVKEVGRSPGTRTTLPYLPPAPWICVVLMTANNGHALWICCRHPSSCVPEWPNWWTRRIGPWGWNLCWNNLSLNPNPNQIQIQMTRP
jgi:hypothetical protein